MGLVPLRRAFPAIGACACIIRGRPNLRIMKLARCASYRSTKWRVVSFPWACRLISVDLAPLSPSIRNLKSHDIPDGSNGVDLKHKDVVRTTSAMVIHSVGRTRRGPPEMKRPPSDQSCSLRRAILFCCQLQRPEAERQRGGGWQSQTVVCAGDNGAAALNMPCGRMQSDLGIPQSTGKEDGREMKEGRVTSTPEAGREGRT